MVEGHGPPGTRGHGGDEGVADICPTLPPDASGVTTLPRSGAIAQHESAPETDRACGTVSRGVGRVEGHIDGPGACQMVGMDARNAGYQTSHRLVRHRTPDDAHHSFGPGGHAATCVIPHPPRHCPAKRTKRPQSTSGRLGVAHCRGCSSKRHLLSGLQPMRHYSEFAKTAIGQSRHGQPSVLQSNNTAPAERTGSVCFS